MLIPICTCGNILSNIQLPYQKDIQDLCDKYSIDHDLISRGILNNEKFNKEKTAIVHKYVDEHNYCCTMHLQNFSDIVRLVK